MTESVVPIADIKPIAVAQRMVTARWHPIVPRIFLATGLPLTRHPPTAYLDRLCRIGEIENHNDVADIALDRRRDIGVSAVKIETMHTAADCPPFGDQSRIGRIRNVVNVDTAAKLVRRGFAELLLIDNHDVARDPHFVRVPALTHRDLGEMLRGRADRPRRLWSSPRSGA